MRGTVLLLDGDSSLLVAADLFRRAGLMVHHYGEAARALQHFQDSGADVIVVASTQQYPSTVREFRQLAGDATSIVVSSGVANREEARAAGADSFLLNSAPPADLLYEIHRALILHRSGRRLPWNW
jgi:DNA-binding NarL/FixJ family response regulator